MVDTSKQLEALENLSRLCLVGMARGCKTDTYRHPKHSEAMALYQKAQAEQTAWYAEIVAAQGRLLQTGFPVPDSWLLADGMGAVELGREKVKGRTVFCVRIAGPDTKALGAICDEIRIAQVRLRFTPKLWADAPAGSDFVAGQLQQDILSALAEKALKKQPLADIVCAGEGTRLYRVGGIKELIEAGLVARKNGIGYYRPDAPPPGLIVQTH